MKHPIDPKIDCVFKALLGAERNRRLLIHVLNAILAGELAAPLTGVEILNPYNEREFLDDKLRSCLKTKPVIYMTVEPGSSRLSAE